MEILRQRSRYVPISICITSDYHIGYSPVDPTAWSFTACLSRLKALSSAPLKAELSELANRRWKGVRTAGDRIWDARRCEARIRGR